MQDYHEALMRLERSAGELRGEARTAVLRRWVAVLKVLRFPRVSFLLSFVC